MSSIFKTYTLDAGLEKDGVEIDFDDLKVVLARAGGANTKFKHVFQQVSKPYRHQINNETLEDDVATRILAITYAKTVIKGIAVLKTRGEKEEDNVWVEGVPTEDGKILPYNEVNVIALLVNLPEFFKDLQEISANVGNYRKDLDGEDLKNSKTASSGS